MYRYLPFSLKFVMKLDNFYRIEFFLVCCSQLFIVLQLPRHTVSLMTSRVVASNRPTELLASVIGFRFCSLVIKDTLSNQEENSTMDRLLSHTFFTVVIIFFSGCGPDLRSSCLSYFIDKKNSEQYPVGHVCVCLLAWSGSPTKILFRFLIL